MSQSLFWSLLMYLSINAVQLASRFPQKTFCNFCTHKQQRLHQCYNSNQGSIPCYARKAQSSVSYQNSGLLSLSESDLSQNLKDMELRIENKILRKVTEHIEREIWSKRHLSYLTCCLTLVLLFPRSRHPRTRSWLGDVRTERD